MGGKTAGSSYAIQSADAGKTIYFVQTSECNGVVSTKQTATYKVASIKNFSNTQSPQIAFSDGLAASSNHKAGTTIYVTRGGWSPAPQAYSYQWFKNGAPIPGATAGSYVLNSKETGSTFKVSVTVTSLGYAPYTYTSPGIVVTGLIASK